MIDNFDVGKMSRDELNERIKNIFPFTLNQEEVEELLANISNHLGYEIEYRLKYKMKMKPGFDLPKTDHIFGIAGYMSSLGREVGFICESLVFQQPGDTRVFNDLQFYRRGRDHKVEYYSRKDLEIWDNVKKEIGKYFDTHRDRLKQA